MLTCPITKFPSGVLQERSHFLLPTEREALIILPGSDTARCQSLVLSLPQGRTFFYLLGQVLGEHLTEVGVFVQD